MEIGNRLLRKLDLPEQIYPRRLVLEKVRNRVHVLAQACGPIGQLLAWSRGEPSSSYR